jgi:hypothetical protein
MVMFDNKPSVNQNKIEELIEIEKLIKGYLFKEWQDKKLSNVGNGDSAKFFLDPAHSKEVVVKERSPSTELELVNSFVPTLSKKYSYHYRQLVTTVIGSDQQKISIPIRDSHILLELVSAEGKAENLKVSSSKCDTIDHNKFIGLLESIEKNKDNQKHSYEELMTRRFNKLIKQVLENKYDQELSKLFVSNIDFNPSLYYYYDENENENSEKNQWRLVYITNLRLKSNVTKNSLKEISDKLPELSNYIIDFLNEKGKQIKELPLSRIKTFH